MTNTHSAPDWIDKPLAELNSEQWEALCDGCGKCCLHKYYADEDDKAEIASNPNCRPEWLDHEYVYSQMACELYDIDKGCCGDYHDRQAKMPDCVQLTFEAIPKIDWLPETCAYRLRFNNAPLPEWHPLLSANPNSVIEAGVAIRSWAVGFNHKDDPLDYLLNFIP